MALRGNLRDFSLPDVFQLVQLSRKTGVLRIVAPGAEGSIWFRDGEVFFAQSNWRREQLGQRLVHSQKITPAALQRALQIQAAEPPGGRRLGQILVDEGYITQQVLEAFVQEQIQDTIFDIMRWDEGDFDFEVLPEVVREDIGLAVSVENIVMEGSRRLEEWNRIKKKVPSTEMVFKMATAPGEGTFEISLKPVEWNLLLLLDGTRSVRELALETGRTDFEVARIIYGLFSAGLLEVASEEEVARLRAERAQREQKRAARLGAQPGVPPVEAREPSVPAAEAIAESPVEREPAAEARPAAEEPAFLSQGAAPPSADDMAVFEEMMSAVLSPSTGAAVPEPPAVVMSDEEETPAGPAYAPISDLDIESIPAPPVAEASSAPTFVPSGDLEADVRALGLGELPEELLAPPEEEEPEITIVPEGPEEAEEAAPAVQEAPIEPEAEEDLEALLRSLEAETEPAGGVISSGTDYGAEESPTEGVISTDAFLAEFDSGGLTSGLADEITALTGGGSGRQRPVTTVAKLPEPGEGSVLHRDQMVDRDLVMKIIEGISKL